MYTYLDWKIDHDRYYHGTREMVDDIERCLKASYSINFTIYRLPLIYRKDVNYELAWEYFRAAGYELTISKTQTAQNIDDSTYPQVSAQINLLVEFRLR